VRELPSLNCLKRRAAYLIPLALVKDSPGDNKTASLQFSGGSGLEEVHVHSRRPPSARSSKNARPVTPLRIVGCSHGFVKRISPDSSVGISSIILGRESAKRTAEIAVGCISVVRFTDWFCLLASYPALKCWAISNRPLRGLSIRFWILASSL